MLTCFGSTPTPITSARHSSESVRRRCVGRSHEIREPGIALEGIMRPFQHRYRVPSALLARRRISAARPGRHGIFKSPVFILMPSIITLERDLTFPMAAAAGRSRKSAFNVRFQTVLPTSSALYITGVAGVQDSCLTARGAHPKLNQPIVFYGADRPRDPAEDAPAAGSRSPSTRWRLLPRPARHVRLSRTLTSLCSKGPPSLNMGAKMMMKNGRFPEPRRILPARSTRSPTPTSGHGR